MTITLRIIFHVTAFVSALAISGCGAFDNDVRQVFRKFECERRASPEEIIDLSKSISKNLNMEFHLGEITQGGSGVSIDINSKKIYTSILIFENSTDAIVVSAKNGPAQEIDKRIVSRIVSGLSGLACKEIRAS